MAIKSILREELANSQRMKRDYERVLAKLPRGSLVRRTIKGNSYYYLIYRQDGRFRSIYKGTAVPEATLLRYQRAKALRAKYRQNLSKVKRQIAFLRGAVRGKEPV
jgi:hypothetical protein